VEQVYRPRRPKESPLWQCLQEHFDRFVDAYEERYHSRYGFLIVEQAPRVQVPVRLLRGEDLGDPVFHCRFQRRLGLDDLLVALRVDHLGQADGLENVVHPGIGTRTADTRPDSSLICRMQKTGGQEDGE